ncbi:DoxX family membrane protein [Pseudokineococcus marinus]|uniref:DoxX family membrane protein n=1 Tax=Pseudokineococcus marinus TaxID=351215 RepID=A0A849BGP2_9ACTN|nr:DoxX family membrane protein [Pseudokineococcus marinus]NNH22270.1 DoxX family membrane protein [Pseudokineococcus marinus]
MLPEPVRDLALLLARLLVGVVLAVHGWDKLVDQGVQGTAGFLGSLGVPAPEVAAVAVSVVELLGGLLLVLGAATTLVSVLVLVDMAGAFWLVHRGNGVLVDGGGWELVGVVAAAALALLGAGPGRASLDHLVGARRSRPRR